MIHSVILMNPMKKKKTKSHIGGSKVAKKRHAKKHVKHNPKKRRHNARPAGKVTHIHHYKNPKRHSKRRNPKRGTSAAVNRMKSTLTPALGAAVGIVASRMIVNFALPKLPVSISGGTTSGYVKAGLQAVTGLVLGAIVGKVYKKNKAIGTAISMGGMVAAILQVADTVTANKYGLSDIDGGKTQVVFLPDRQYAALPAASGSKSMADYHMADYHMSGAKVFNKMF